MIDARLRDMQRRFQEEQKDLGKTSG